MMNTKCHVKSHGVKGCCHGKKFGNLRNREKGLVLVCGIHRSSTIIECQCVQLETHGSDSVRRSTQFSLIYFILINLLAVTLNDNIMYFMTANKYLEPNRFSY